MKHPNYQHLLYFWTAAREGGVTAASRALHVTPATVSVQIRQLEEEFGLKLFQRHGRGLKLTRSGEAVQRYADRIFSSGRELMSFLESDEHDGRLLFDVGVTNALPKALTARLLQPVIQRSDEVRLVTHEASGRELVERLLLHQIDVALSDMRLDTDNDRLRHHEVGHSQVTIVGKPGLVDTTKGFPQLLHGAPLVLPTVETSMRRAIDDCLDELNLHPLVVAEFEDSALLKLVASNGLGLVPVPERVCDEVCAQYGMVHYGTLDEVYERIYVVTVRREEPHPFVNPLLLHARQLLNQKALD